MLIPPHGTARDLDTLPDSKANLLVCNNYITTLRKRRNHTGNGRERLGVHDACRGAEIRRNIGLGRHVDVLGAVKSARTTRANAVVAQRLNGFFLERLVGIEVVEIGRTQVHDRATIRQLGLGADGTAHAMHQLPLLPA